MALQLERGWSFKPSTPVVIWDTTISISRFLVVVSVFSMLAPTNTVLHQADGVNNTVVYRRGALAMRFQLRSEMVATGASIGLAAQIIQMSVSGRLSVLRKLLQSLVAAGTSVKGGSVYYQEETNVK